MICKTKDCYNEVWADTLTQSCKDCIRLRYVIIRNRYMDKMFVKPCIDAYYLLYEDLVNEFDKQLTTLKEELKDVKHQKEVLEKRLEGLS